VVGPGLDSGVRETLVVGGSVLVGDVLPGDGEVEMW
jgi:hypothetical protein